MIGRCSTKTRSPAKRPRGRVEDGEVAVRVRRRPSLQLQRPPAKIQRQTISYGQGRRNESHLVDELVANDPPKRLQVEFAAHRQRSWQIVVADKSRAKPIKGGVAKDVIGMLMRIDDIEDGLARASADGGEQPLADRHAAAGVDDRHALVTDHEADIGDIAKVLFAHQGDFAGMDEHARRDFVDCQRGQSFVAQRGFPRERQDGDEGADQPAHVPIRHFLVEHSSGRRQ